MTADQLGVSRRVVDRLVAQGHLHPIHAGVFAVGHPRLSREARWLAATMALAPDGVLAYRAAGALWGVLRGAQPIEVIVSPRMGRGHRDGIRVHRQRLEPREWTRRDGIPTTTLARTICDLAAVLDRGGVARAFEESQVQHHLGPAAVAVELLAHPGRRGARTLRALIAEAVEPGEVESVLELRFLRLCADHGLPRPQTQSRFGPWRADFCFPAERLVIETDGDRFHAGARRRARDARKAESLEAAGARVLRLSWTQVVRRPAATAAAVRAALDARNTGR